MRTRIFVALIALAGVSPAFAAPPANLDKRVEELRRASELPGLAIAIVENGETTLARGYGVRKLGGTDLVNADTIFMTGSTGKAVTVAALATLVDAGKIGWDDKVIDHLPGFQMYDPLGHARNDDPRPFGPSQRPRLGGRGPYVRSAEQSHPRRHACRTAPY